MNAPPAISGTLRLSLAALSEFLRWRGQDAAGRRWIERSYPPALTATLQRLEQNLTAVGDVNAAMIDHARTRRPATGLLDTLLAGLDLEERALPDFVRACRVSPFREQALGDAVRELMREAWAPNEARRQAAQDEEAREAAELKRRNADRLHRLATEVDLRRLDLGLSVPGGVQGELARLLECQLDQVTTGLTTIRKSRGIVLRTKRRTPTLTTHVHTQGKNMSVLERQAAAAETIGRNGKAPAVEEIPAGLTERQQLVWRELERRGLSPRAYVEWRRKEDVAKALMVSSGTVQNELKAICAKLGIEMPKADQQQAPESSAENSSVGHPADHAPPPAASPEVTEPQSTEPAAQSPERSMVQAVPNEQQAAEAILALRDRMERERDEARGAVLAGAKCIERLARELRTQDESLARFVDLARRSGWNGDEHPAEFLNHALGSALERVQEMHDDRESEGAEIGAALDEEPELELEESQGVRAAMCIQRLREELNEAQREAREAAARPDADERDALRDRMERERDEARGAVSRLVAEVDELRAQIPVRALPAPAEDSVLQRIVVQYLAEALFTGATGMHPDLQIKFARRMLACVSGYAVQAGGAS